MISYNNGNHDVFKYMLSFVHVETLGQCPLVCHAWNNYMTDTFWKSICKGLAIEGEPRIDEKWVSFCRKEVDFILATKRKYKGWTPDYLHARIGDWCTSIYVNFDFARLNAGHIKRIMHQRYADLTPDVTSYQTLLWRNRRAGADEKVIKDDNERLPGLLSDDQVELIKDES